MEEKEELKPEINCGFVGRLYPTPEQEKIMSTCIEISRCAYNWARWKNLQEYEEVGKLCNEYVDTLKDKNLSEEEIYKMKDKYWKKLVKEMVTPPLKLSTLYTQEVNSNPEKYSWMKKGTANSRCDTFKANYGNAIKNFYKNIKDAVKRVKDKKNKNPKKTYKFPRDYGFPKYKLRGNSYPLRIAKCQLDYENNRIYIEKCGWVQVSNNQPLPGYDYPTDKAGNPKVIFDGLHYFISFSYHKDVEVLSTLKTDVLGVDLGIKNIATLSTGEMIENVANDERIIKLTNRLKKFQKKLCWLVEHSPLCFGLSKKEAWKVSSKQTRKLKKLINKIQIKINNIKKYEKHTTAERIVRANPEGIVFETLQVKNMFKNKKLSSKLQQTGMSEYKQILINHAKKHGIPYKEESQWFASSQTCSNCGYVEHSMKNLSKRTFVCPNCGLKMDRDVNAAKNLKARWNEHIQSIS